MGKIIRNGIEYSGSYDDATSVNYDNSVSGLKANTVQEGIDELTKGSVGAFPVDNLLSTATDIPLSANQGRILDEKISSVNSSLEDKNTWKLVGRMTSTNAITIGNIPTDAKEVLYYGRTPYYFCTAILPFRGIVATFLGNEKQGIYIDGGKVVGSYQDGKDNKSNAYVDIYYR